MLTFCRRENGFCCFVIPIYNQSFSKSKLLLSLGPVGFLCFSKWMSRAFMKCLMRINGVELRHLIEMPVCLVVFKSGRGVHFPFVKQIRR